MERAALCLQLDGRYQEARDLASEELKTAPAVQASALPFRRSMSDVFLGGPAGAQRAGAGGSGGRAASRALLVPHMAHMLAGRWQDADAALPDEKLLGGDLVATAWLAQGRAALARATDLPRKSAALAGLLGTVIPGAGRVYLGRWQDGLVSFALTALPAYLAADAFVERGTTSVRGWILGSFAGFMWASNIYGSAVGAEAFNRQQEEFLRRDLEQEYRDRLDP